MSFFPEDSPFKNVFDLLYDFYENAALYKVDSRTENELIVSFNDKSMELNKITAPEQSNIVTRIYKGRFKTTIRLESEKIKARVVLLNDSLKRLKITLPLSCGEQENQIVVMGGDNYILNYLKNSLCMIADGVTI